MSTTRTRQKSGECLIRPITSGETWTLRHRILRPQQAIEEMNYPGDDHAETVHFGAFDGDNLIGIASLYHQPMPQDPQPGDWQLRGMAVDESRRGTGIGQALITVCHQHIKTHGGRRLWCNARTSAHGFYERLGLTVRGEMFDLVAIGPHVVMAVEVENQ